jgi:hypothetical protein
VNALIFGKDIEFLKMVKILSLWLDRYIAGWFSLN